jgi:hypothetical protein
MPGRFVRAAVEKKRTAVYIDGYNLYYGRLRGTAFKWLDLLHLFDNLMAIQEPAAFVEAVKFFSATALGNFASHGQASVEAQDSYHRAMAARHPDRFSIKLGNHSMDRKGSLMPAFVEGQRFDRNVQARVWRIEEKMTDVNIAMAIATRRWPGLVRRAVDVCQARGDKKPGFSPRRRLAQAGLYLDSVPVIVATHRCLHRTQRRFGANFEQPCNSALLYLGIPKGSPRCPSSPSSR